jgi:hypothetical protein
VAAVRAREGVGEFVTDFGHGELASNGLAAKGVTDRALEVPAPMRAIMAENSRALESLTKKSACSDSDKQSADQDS